MEVLLFALFFIASLIFFIAGKDDFGRKEKKEIVKKTELINNEAKSDPKENLKDVVGNEVESVKEENPNEVESVKKENPNEVVGNEAESNTDEKPEKDS